MIDFVRMNANIFIAPEQLRPNKWKMRITEQGEPFYKYSKGTVSVTSYPYRESPVVHINGKLINLLHNTQVFNPDDYYGTDIEQFIDDFNEKLNSLLTEPLLDIRTFTVTRIDYCVNVKTPYVKQYIDFFNKAFEYTESTTRVDYTLEKNEYGSCYVKTRSEYKQNTRKNYVVNFYDKTDWLNKRRAKRYPIPRDDIERARDVLRLEVQCGGDLLRNSCEEIGIERTFGTLCTFDMALHFIEKIYALVFHGSSEENYYNYQTAKKILAANRTQKRSAKKGKGLSKPEQALLQLGQNHHIAGSGYSYARNRIKVLHIYPYCLIPTSWGIDYLDNPITLIHKKIASMS